MKLLRLEPKTIDYKIYKLGYRKTIENDQTVQYENWVGNEHISTVILKHGELYSIEKVVGYGRRVKYNEEFTRKEFKLFMKKMKYLMRVDK